MAKDVGEVAAQAAQITQANIEQVRAMLSFGSSAEPGAQEAR